MARGTTPSMKARDVMMIGRKRTRAANIAATSETAAGAPGVDRELDDQDGVLTAARPMMGDQGLSENRRRSSVRGK